MTALVGASGIPRRDLERAIQHLYRQGVAGYFPIMGLLRYWGYLALALAIVGWVAGVFKIALILIFSLAALGYFLLQAPAWCGAITRTGQMCRNNSTGLLLGCHLREHKWQKIKMTFIPRQWREINRSLWASPRESVTTLSGLAAVVSAVAAVLALH